MPAPALLLLFVSRRTRGIFFLGLFNDCFSAALAYFAVYLFVQRRWMPACIVFRCGAVEGGGGAVVVLLPDVLLMLVLAPPLLRTVSVCPSR